MPVIIRYGNLYAWGYNGNGQLGDGTTVDKVIPTKIGDTKWKDISVSNTHSLGITEDGDLYGWGRNNNGQLGDGTTVDKLVPTKIGDLKWSSVSTGSWNSSAITEDGDLYTWGYNGYGQLGDGTTENKLLPTKVGTMKWKKVVTGNNQVLAITIDGDLYGWGQNGGNGFSENKTTPTKIGNFKWSTISLGATHSLGITTDGDLYAWGSNTYGQLGDGTTTQRNVPTKIGVMKWKEIKGDYYSTSAITTDGDLYAWGSNAKGQLGDGTTTQRNVPTKIGNLKWSSFIHSTNFTYYLFLAIAEGNLLYAWGSNAKGQLGDGTTENKLVPTFILNLILNKTLILHDGEYKKFEEYDYNTVLDTTVSASSKLVNYFKFDEASGNAIDSKGSAIGTVTGATRVQGWNGEGSAMNFDGSSYITFNSSSIIPSGANPFSIRLKVFANSINGDDSILNQGYDSTTGGVRLDFLADKRLIFIILGTSSTDQTNCVSKTYFEINKWYDIIITFDGTLNNNALKIYINGVLDSEHRLKILPRTSSRVMYISYGNSAYPRMLNGIVDNVEIYNGALLEKEIYQKNTVNWEAVSSTLPTQEQFISDGLDSLSPLLDRRIETLDPLPMTDKSEILLNGEEGKVFNRTLDLKKYLDIRSIKVEVK